MKKPGMKRKPQKLSLGERIDLLMQDGIEHPEKWMPVHGYNGPDVAEHGSPTLDWFAEWYQLNEHHLAETKFLFEVIAELCHRLQHEYDLNDDWD